MRGAMKWFESRQDLAPKLLAVPFGLAFLIAGLDKVFTLEMARGMFGQLFGAGLSWMVYVAIVIELIGGAALLLNWHRREAALVLALLILVAFVVTFKLGQAPHFIGTLREIVVMKVNFAYFFALLALAFSGCKQCSMK